MILRQIIQRVFFVLVCAITLSSVARAGDEVWRPVDPAHVAMKTPLVEKDADAEAIFWDVSVQDEMSGSEPRTVRRNYIRIKIFTERGIESQSKIDLPYLSRSEIKDIAARTIKPDGTIVELKKDAIFNRVIIKTSGIKLKAKSFALPGVEPGLDHRVPLARGPQGPVLLLHPPSTAKGDPRPAGQVLGQAHEGQRPESEHEHPDVPP